MANNSQADPAQDVSVLFVCLGNICRSPMGHAVLQDMVAKLPKPAPKVTIDSAGTGAYHELSPPDPRTLQTLRRYGVNDFDHAARKIRSSDFSNFDYILAMDSDNLEDLKYKQRSVMSKGKEGDGGKQAKVMLFGEFGDRGMEEVDDPYYGGGAGFEKAYEQCVRLSKGWLQKALGVEVE